MLHVVALKFSWNHFISEKYKTVQPFKLEILQNSPLVQLYTSTSKCKGVGNISGSHYVEALFSSSVAFLMMTVTSQKPIPSVLIPVDGTGKNQLEKCQKSMGNAPMLSHFSLLRNPWPNRPVCWSIVVKENPTVVSPFFGAFPTDRIPKVTNNVKVHFCIHSFTEVCLLQQPQ